MEAFKNKYEKSNFERNSKLFTNYIRNIKKELKPYIKRYDFHEEKLRLDVLIDFKGVFFDLLVSNVKLGIEVKVICSSRKFNIRLTTFDEEIGSKLLPLFDSVSRFEPYPYED